MRGNLCCYDWSAGEAPPPCLLKTTRNKREKFGHFSHSENAFSPTAATPRRGVRTAPYAEAAKAASDVMHALGVGWANSICPRPGCCIRAQTPGGHCWAITAHCAGDSWTLANCWCRSSDAPCGCRACRRPSFRNSWSPVQRHGRQITSLPFCRCCNSSSALLVFGAFAFRPLNPVMYRRAAVIGRKAARSRHICSGCELMKPCIYG